MRILCEGCSEEITGDRRVQLGYESVGHPVELADKLTSSEPLYFHDFVCVTDFFAERASEEDAVAKATLKRWAQIRIDAEATRKLLDRRDGMLRDLTAELEKVPLDDKRRADLEVRYSKQSEKLAKQLLKEV